jgi:hypothetical protein
VIKLSAREEHSKRLKVATFGVGEWHRLAECERVRALQLEHTFGRGLRAGRKGLLPVCPERTQEGGRETGAAEGSNPHPIITNSEGKVGTQRNHLVTRMILESRYGSDGVRDLDLFIAKAQVSLATVDEEQAHLARALDEPLLFKGNDFPKTDIECHPASSGQ